MSQEVKTGKILSPSTPWTARGVPGIETPDEQQALKAIFTEPTIECPECHALVTRTAMSFNAYVCPQCDEHLRMKARERLTEAQKKTGETEALVVMQGLLKDMPVIACAFEFDFMGGSMGTVVGDRFVQAAERAIQQKQPLICFAASGGARMQEGMLSLMQMARTSAAIQRMKEAGLPYIVVLTHPVYGGVTASLAMLGDVHIAEPQAMIGFAGKRVIEQTVREKLEEPFQRAEYLLDHGVVDQIVHRHALRDTVYRILAKLMNLP